MAREKAREVTGAKAETEADLERNKAESMAVVFIIVDGIERSSSVVVLIKRCL